MFKRARGQMRSQNTRQTRSTSPVSPVAMRALRGRGGRCQWRVARAAGTAGRGRPERVGECGEIMGDIELRSSGTFRRVASLVGRCVSRYSRQ
eukprot:1567230-Prymnesium_polylepis.1